MNYRKLGNSGINVSEWSLGCSGIGGLNQLYGSNWGWPEVPDADVEAALARALDLGVNHFDTADLYGCGESERRLARTLVKLGRRPDEFVISSKVGWLRGSAEHAYDPWHIKRQCEQSLRNLQREAIDLYYLHHGNFGPDDRWLEGAAQALDELQAEGKIRLKGQSAYSAADFAKSAPVVRPAVFQSRASLLDVDFVAPDSPTSALMAREGITFIAFSPLAAGLLTDAYDPDNPPEFPPGESRRSNKRFQAEYLRRLKPKLEAMKAHFYVDAAGLPAIALRYVLDQPHVSAVLNGFQRASDIESSAGVLDRHLTARELNWLDDLFADLRA